MKRQPEPPALPKPEPWTVEIEPMEKMPFGFWRIRLVRGFMAYGGNDGFGWLAYTLAGARRKGARELARRIRKDAALAARRERVA